MTILLKQKHLLLFLSFVVCGINSIIGHEVDRYRYLCLDITENPYGIEKRFIEEFKKIGFTTINSEHYELLHESQKPLTLFAEYNYFINHNGPSNLTITLRNAAGAPVWTFTGYGNTFLSAKGDMKNASKQIIRAFSQLKYKFNANLSTPPTIELPYASWSEDSVKSYLRIHNISQVEGIYKNFSNDGDSYNIAILRYDDKYFGVILESDHRLWKKGQTKFVLSHIEDGAYDAEYFNANHQKLNAIAVLKDNRELSFSAPYLGDVLNFSFIKVFPSGRERLATGTSSQCMATGSGILISDNIIITNYHVVKDAERIEAIVNENGIPESYSARTLCTDKTNDLAIVCIKDEKFRNKDSFPFKILSHAVDVGTSVFTMGFPRTSILGEEVKVTDGIISSKSGYEGDIVTYQITAPIQPGNSGGPLFDKNGNLVGITSSGIVNKNVAENVGYAIKSPYILNIIDSSPINIRLPQGQGISEKDNNIKSLVKSLKPYVVYLKIY